MNHTWRRLAVSVACVALVAAGACSAGAVPSRDPAGDLVVSTSWLADRLNDSDVVVIATGTRASYEAGHIPGARFIAHQATLGSDHRMLEGPDLAEALAAVGVTDDSRVVLYGDQPMTTGWLYMAFASIGHGNHVSLLSGNINAWKADGHPVTSDPPPPLRGALTVRKVPDVIVAAPWVLERLEAPGVQVLDVRTQREWDNGRLPGAQLVLWQDLFTDSENGRFKSRDEIRELLAKAGADAAGQVVTYCAIGMRASLMYVAARYAGFDTRVYLGSWEDWQRQSGYPIVRPPE